MVLRGILKRTTILSEVCEEDFLLESPLFKDKSKNSSLNYGYDQDDPLENLNLILAKKNKQIQQNETKINQQDNLIAFLGK